MSDREFDVHDLLRGIASFRRELSTSYRCSAFSEYEVRNDGGRQSIKVSGAASA
jgi:hypothetical protein